ncbi:hypothetical protein [Dictyobacter formicarum]|uniref:Uncharacterized protein n=1 Tax=Dictyobacter formicarum TaxID=2778368 RepID=A0ABQ3VX12_9CHLR|nr:hypothetical protein [Dictyobacter formicarum]GHO89913.1 hypothetical protein KSZ_79190 [Dictyobacter formicarum]
MSKTQPRRVKQDRLEKQQRREAERLRELKRKRTTNIIVISAIALVVVIIGAFIWFANRPTGGSTSTSSQTSSSSSSGPYAPLNGISCDSQEQLAYHIHAHLSIYIDGKAVSVPQAIGIASDQSCIYWLHTHDTTGVIHIESPTQKNYTLGDFTQIWSQRFSNLQYPYQLDKGAGWQAYVDGKPYNGDFHNIVLKAHTLVTLAYNSPNVKPDTTYAWQQGE